MNLNIGFSDGVLCVSAWIIGLVWLTTGDGKRESRDGGGQGGFFFFFLEDTHVKRGRGRETGEFETNFFNAPTIKTASK